MLPLVGLLLGEAPLDLDEEVPARSRGLLKLPL